MQDKVRGENLAETFSNWRQFFKILVMQSRVIFVRQVLRKVHRSGQV